MEFNFKSKLTIALILLFALLSVELYILLKPSKSSTLGSVSELKEPTSNKPAANGGSVKPSTRVPKKVSGKNYTVPGNLTPKNTTPGNLTPDPIVDPIVAPQPNRKKDSPAPAPTPAPPVPTHVASETSFILKSKGPILFRTTDVYIDHTLRSFSFLFKGLSNLNHVPREFKSNMVVILTTAEIENNLETLRELTANGDVTLILQLDAEQQANAVDEDVTIYYVNWLNYSDIAYSFAYMMLSDYENVDPQVPLVMGRYGVQLVKPGTMIDSNHSSAVLRGAVVVDLSKDPETVINTLKSHPQKNNKSDFLTAVSVPNSQFLFTTENIQKFRNDLENAVYLNALETEIEIDRERILEDSITKLPQNSYELMRTKFKFKFTGEIANDDGGVTREWYNSIAAELFKPERKLFIASDVDPTVFHPNYKLNVTHEHLRLFEFAGKFFAKALVDKIAFGLHFSDAFYKHILGLEPEFKDLENSFKAIHGGFSYLSGNPFDEAGFEDTSFEIEDDNHKPVELIPGGKDIKISEENKAEFIALTADYMLTTGIEEQAKAFLRGFYSHLQFNSFAPLSVSDLDQLIAGAQNIDVEDWCLNTSYHEEDRYDPYNANSPQVKWFWDALRSFTQEELRKVLQFATGLPSVPIGGFANLRNGGEIKLFTIHKDRTELLDDGPARLPSAHTCFHTIDLPLYRNYDELRERLLKAAEVGVGFGFV